MQEFITRGTGILERLLSILERLRGIVITTDTQRIVFLAILGFGVLNCLFGYRLLRFWVMLFGFAIGAGAAYFVLQSTNITDNNKIYLAACIGIGVVLALIAFLIYRAGIFLLGAGLGIVGSVYLIHPRTSAVFFLCILIGVFLGSLALRYSRGIIIIGTGVMGGLLTGFALQKLLGLSEIPYGVAMMACLSVLSIVIQFAINRYPEEEEGTEEEEERSPEEPDEEPDEDEDAEEDFYG